MNNMFDKPLTKDDLIEGKKISELFEILDDTSKMMAVVYLSALRDKQLVS